MKVLKPAEPFRPFRARCGTCGTEVEIERPDDLERYQDAGDQRDPRDRGSDYARWECPTCKVKNIVRKDAVPAHIYDRLRYAEKW